jgi:predicted DNA-binding protein (UPF0251 family)
LLVVCVVVVRVVEAEEMLFDVLRQVNLHPAKQKKAALNLQISRSEKQLTLSRSNKVTFDGKHH